MFCQSKSQSQPKNQQISRTIASAFAFALPLVALAFGLALTASVSYADDASSNLNNDVAEVASISELKSIVTEPVLIRVSPRLEFFTNRAGYAMPVEKQQSITLDKVDANWIASKALTIEVGAARPMTCDLESRSNLGYPVTISSNEQYEFVSSKIENGAQLLNFRLAGRGRSAYNRTLRFKCYDQDVTVAQFVEGLRQSGIEMGTAQALNTRYQDSSGTALASRRLNLKPAPQN